MEISANTVKVLQNFASINSNIVIQPGNTIMTISEAKNILSQATLTEQFDSVIGIYDLQNFLSVLDLVDNASVQFKDNYMVVGGNAGRSMLKYYYADPEMLTSPSKPINMPKADVSFTLDQPTLNNLKRAANILNHTQLVIEPDGGSIKLSIVDIENTTANTYSIVVEGEYNTDNFKFVLNINNLKLITDDYKVDISSKLISQFSSVTHDVKYWIALEKTSIYGV
tara:strand:- start:2985 stop:3659 length:675 start_codon:yes stop_codon:yes gene_type:complete